MKINNSLKKFLIVFVSLDLLLMFYSIVFENIYWLLNSQVAFFSSLFITLASFLSYKRNISSRLSSLDKKQTILSEDRDKIDEIDDPFDLYSEYEEIPEEELTPNKIKEIIQEEKTKVKRNSFKNTLFSAGGYLSIYRILGYGALVFGFFALNNNNLFLPFAFLIGLGITPLGVLLSKFLDNKR